VELLRAYCKDRRQQAAKSGQARPFRSAICRPLSAENGIALVMVLILSAIALAVMAALVYMLVASTQSSGMQKRYKTALEAGKAGAAVTYKMIGARGTPDISGISFAFTPTGQSCLTAKLTTPTSAWPNTCNSAISINPGDPTTYDMSFNLGVTANYTVRAKIVDTVNGNSGASLGLQKSGVVSSNSGEITVQSMPYLYTIEVDAENSNNPQERGQYEVLYQY
jgi:hypothetical protein